MMLDATAPVAAQEVAAKAVGRGMDKAKEPVLQFRPLRGIYIALEHGVLHTLTVIEACLRHPCESPTSLWRHGRDVVRHED